VATENRIIVINIYTKFHCNLTSSFSGTVHQSWRNNTEEEEEEEEGEKTGKEKLVDTFMTLLRHDGAT
jgi:hypothetical protein